MKWTSLQSIFFSIPQRGGDFKSNLQEYLITQIQRRITHPKNTEGKQLIARGDTFSTGKFNLNHPCKYMMWYYLSNFGKTNGTFDVTLNQTPGLDWVLRYLIQSRLCSMKRNSSLREHQDGGDSIKHGKPNSW